MAITLGAFAQTYEPLPEFPALPPAALSLNLPSVPSLVLPMPTAADGLDDTAPVLTLYPTALPLALTQISQPQ